MFSELHNLLPFPFRGTLTEVIITHDSLQRFDFTTARNSLRPADFVRSCAHTEKSCVLPFVATIYSDCLI